jgi:hypothetical protein
MKPPVKPDGQCRSCWTWIRCLRVCSHTVMTVSFERSLSGVEITTVIPSCSITTACIQRAGRTWSRTDSAEAAELAHGLNSMPACVSHTVMTVSFERSLSGVEITTSLSSLCPSVRSSMRIDTLKTPRLPTAHHRSTRQPSLYWVWHCSFLPTKNGKEINQEWPSIHIPI